MAQFTYKTRGDSSPQGKPRVYFCAHPGDLLLLDEISSELLSHQNCAVWYDTEPEAPFDEELFFTDLKQMNLFVLPVTTRFLTTPSRARDVEFPFAVAQGIPVLPLMQERGLEELFNRVCGDRQFLTKLDPDPTAIPYEEKLTRYLNSVLIGDELAARVRAAFDAHIFLSYRKKDRALAQELMRLIHRNDFCRDVAIWYDEFLTPGENFNEAIERALKECDLFALAVTPNLVNEKNYVMTVEYPMAKAADRKILPAAMRKVPQWWLKLRYKKITNQINAHDTKALAKALADALEGVAKRENDNDPAHNYLIGLAYLNGIDVEVDRERAVTLITGAAEAGIPEAMEKLVSMYREGEGVERDYEKAIEWQRKLVGYWRKAYETRPDEESGLELFTALWRLGDYLYELRRIYDMKATYCDLNRLADELHAAYATQETLRSLSVSLGNLGDISIALGNPREAEAYYTEALNIFMAIAAKADTTEARRDVSVSLKNLGNVRHALGNPEEAEEYYTRALAIDEALAAETGTVEVRRSLAIGLDDLGNMRQELGDPHGAAAYYARALAIREAIAAEAGTPKARCDLSISLHKLGAAHRALGDSHTAETYHTRSLEIDEALAAETGSIEAQRHLSVSLTCCGDIRGDLGDLKGAEAYYVRSLQIDENVAAQTDTLEARRDLSISLSRFGEIRMVLGNPAEAHEYFLRSLEIDESIATETGTLEARRDLSVSLNRLGDVRKGLGDLREAEAYYVRSWEIDEAIATETGTVDDRCTLTISLNKLGDICKARKDFESAEAYYMRSLAIRQVLVTETGTIRARRGLSVCLERLGDIRKTLGDPNGAETYYTEALKIAEDLVFETGTVDSYDDLAVSYHKLATLRKPYDRELLQRSLQIYNSLIEKCPDVARYRKMQNTVKKKLESI